MSLQFPDRDLACDTCKIDGMRRGVHEPLSDIELLGQAPELSAEPVRLVRPHDESDPVSHWTARERVMDLTRLPKIFAQGYLLQADVGSAATPDAARDPQGSQDLEVDGTAPGRRFNAAMRRDLAQRFRPGTSRWQCTKRTSGTRNRIGRRCPIRAGKWRPSASRRRTRSCRSNSRARTTSFLLRHIVQDRSLSPVPSSLRAGAVRPRAIARNPQCARRSRRIVRGVGAWSHPRQASGHASGERVPRNRDGARSYRRFRRRPRRTASSPSPGHESQEQCSAKDAAASPKTKTSEKAPR